MNLKKILKLFTLLIISTFLHADSDVLSYNNLKVSEYKLLNDELVYLYVYSVNMSPHFKSIYILKSSNEEKEKDAYLDNNDSELFFYENQKKVEGFVKVLYIGYDNDSIKIDFKDDILKIDAVESDYYAYQVPDVKVIKGVLQQFVWEIEDAQTCKLIEKNSKEIIVERL